MAPPPAAFEAVVNDAGWQKGAHRPLHRRVGGISKTGKDLPDAETGLHRLTAGEAQRIDWGSADEIDWSLYRVFVHPAIED